MFENYTAAELANALDQVQTLNPEYTGPLSMLDEASLRWAIAYPQLKPAQDAFAQARMEMYPIRRTEASVQEMRRVAAELAAQLRTLGQIRLSLCKADSPWGTCNGVLDATGNCRRSHDHTP